MIWKNGFQDKMGPRTIEGTQLEKFTAVEQFELIKDEIEQNK
jgi:hypothetical protein